MGEHTRVAAAALGASLAVLVPPAAVAQQVTVAPLATPRSKREAGARNSPAATSPSAALAAPMTGAGSKR